MTSSAHKAWVYLLLTFLLGIASGAVSGYAYARKSPAPPPHFGMVEKIFVERLALTPEQQGTLKPAWNAASGDFNKAKKICDAQNAEIWKRVHSQVEMVLTPEQKEKLRQMDKDHAEKSRRKDSKNDKPAKSDKTNGIAPLIDSIKDIEKKPSQ
ncbi:MAG: hypothetical protein JWN25_3637 [Verrucomicrobiales bacterium]|nr:hypothetical protein [Verrucomicrobiales bacterium]